MQVTFRNFPIVLVKTGNSHVLVSTFQNYKLNKLKSEFKKQKQNNPPQPLGALVTQNIYKSIIFFQQRLTDFQSWKSSPPCCIGMDRKCTIIRYWRSNEDQAPFVLSFSILGGFWWDCRRVSNSPVGFMES